VVIEVVIEVVMIVRVKVAIGVVIVQVGHSHDSNTELAAMKVVELLE
jgi:hypothetical protein